MSTEDGGAMQEERLHAPRNMSWEPRPGWATVRLVGTCADRSLRRGQVVLHAPGDEYDPLHENEGISPGTMIIVLAEAARLVEDDLHLIPEHAIVAIGQELP